MLSDNTTPNGGELSKEGLRQQVRRFLDEEPGDDDNLMDFGLSSIAAMQLVTEWKQINIEVNFVELAKRPTIDGMWELLQQKKHMLRGSMDDRSTVGRHVA